MESVIIGGAIFIGVIVFVIYIRVFMGDVHREKFIDCCKIFCGQKRAKGIKGIIFQWLIFIILILYGARHLYLLVTETNK